MENNKFWIYLVLGVAAAVTLKWWCTPESSITTKRWAIAANMEDEIQFRRGNQTQKIAGLSNSRRSTELVEVKSGTTAAAAPTAPAPQKVAKLENKAKKKKKKKKKAKVIAVPTSAPATSEQAKAVEPTPATGSASGVTTTAGGVVGGLANPTSQTDWERILLPFPNHHETIRFISLYQSKQIDPQVFYAIVNEMLTDSRVQMRELGVMSLGATPSLKSYEMLVALAENDQSSAKSQAQGYLNDTYNRPQSINVLYAALTEQDVPVQTQVQALRNLDSIITKTRTPSSDATSDPSATSATSKNQSVTQQRVLQYLAQLQVPLHNLSSSTASDAQLPGLAQKDLSEIQAVLSGAPATPDTQVAVAQPQQ